jgi:PAS domain S-box-containing protein
VDEAAGSPTTFDFIAEHTSDVIVRVSRQGLVTYCSPAVRKFGYEPEEFLGPIRVDLLHPDDREGFLANSAALLRGDLDAEVRREHRFRTADGEWAWLEGNPQIVRDAAGEPLEIINAFRDVTRRHALEEQARAQAELFEASFRHAAIGMALVALDGSFLRINAAFCRITGYPEPEMLALDFQTITHPEDLDADLALLQQLTAGERDSYEMDKRYVRADGSIVWVHLTVSMVRNPDGTPHHYVAQVQDLTARRAAEAALAESEARYRLIAENTSDIIVVSDLKGRVTYMSPSIAQTGWRPNHHLGRSFADQVHPEDVGGLRRAFGKLLKCGVREPVRWRGRHGLTGDWMWLESGPSVLHDPESGEPLGFVDVVRDVTHQVKQEQALADARAAAEAAAAAKSQFLANMSHEIRTPLTAVLGFASLLRDDATVTGAAAGYVERITGAGNGLLAIVNDVLDFSKLEAGRFEVRARPTDVAGVCEETLMMFASHAEAKGLELTFNVASGLPRLALIDGDRLRQTLINLVGNAVKFTEAGSVRLSVSAADGGATAVIEVSDTGPGLDAEAQAVLFQRFSQVDGSMTRRHGGTGLGLAICRGLAEAMGGAICVRSAPGEGATFRLALPAPAADIEDDAASQGQASAIDGTRVFVVDDNGTNRELVRRVLEAAGVEVSDASDGASALEQLALRPMDVVLMDLRMPGLDGRQTLARLRACRGPNQDIPVLAFTADADVAGQGDLEVFDGLVRKPIQPADMYAAIAAACRWLPREDEEADHAAAG